VITVMVMKLYISVVVVVVALSHDTKHIKSKKNYSRSKSTLCAAILILVFFASKLRSLLV
jgi:hypothetical protein